MSNDWKSQAESCFDHLELANAMVPLTMPSVSCDAHTAASGITWPKESCDTLFQFSSPDEQDDAIDDAVTITWQQCWY